MNSLQLERILKIALEGPKAERAIFPHLSLALIKYNLSPIDSFIIKSIESVNNASLMEYPLHQEFTMSEEEILSEAVSIAHIADMLITSIIDRQTFGNGHLLTERIAEAIDVPVISFRDEIYSHPTAIAEILAIYEHLGTLKGKRIGVAWGFGSRFVLPSTAHSLVLLASQMGADVRIIEPDKFALLKRVKRTARGFTDKSGSSIVIQDDLSEGLKGLDAVFVSNWCSLDNYQHPERNRDHAAEFKDWFYSEENVSEDCLFLTEPPVQHELLASTGLLRSERNLSTTTYLRRSKILASIIQHFHEQSKSGIRETLI